MDKWEARYKALAAGITDPEMIRQAERFVTTAIERSLATGISFERVFNGMLKAAQLARSIKEEKNMAHRF